MAKDYATIYGLPVYDATIGDADGMLRVSLVDAPAVCSDFIALAAQKPVQLFAIQDEEKRIVRGVIMRADFPIYRRDDQLGEYYIIYTADTIRQMAEKYLADGRQNLVNLMHAEGTDTEGVQMVQYFLKDSAAGVDPEGFPDIADGSLFAEYHVTNDDVWDKVKDGTFRGFSLEGVFDLQPVPADDQAEVTQIARDLAGKFAEIKSVKLNEMSKIERFKAALARLLAKFGDVTTDKGVLAWDGDEDLKAGDAVYILDPEGNRTDAEDGEYTTGDGKTITVEGGKVTSIVDPAAEIDSDFGRKGTDKGDLLWDGEEDLKEGDEVFQEGEDGERQPAADGEYMTDDGKTVVVVDGKVAEIRDPKAEVAPEGEDLRSQRFARVRAAFDESYEDKEKTIFSAIMALGYVDFYLVEAGDDFAIICVWTPDGERYTRFAISWNEDGTAAAVEEEEVKPAFVPADEDADPAPAASEETEELRRQVAALRKEVAQLKAKPAAKPAHEEVQTPAAFRKTGVKGLDRIAQLMGK